MVKEKIQGSQRSSRQVGRQVGRSSAAAVGKLGDNGARGCGSGTTTRSTQTLPGIVGDNKTNRSIVWEEEPGNLGEPFHLDRRRDEGGIGKNRAFSPREGSPEARDGMLWTSNWATGRKVG